ncbi:hypothetical protein D3C84_1014310 [compost metagenome]
MGRELRVDVGLAGAFWPQFDQVVVTLAERDQADQLQQLVTLTEHLRVEANTLNQQIDPLIRGELLTRLQVALEVEPRDLDRLERSQNPRRCRFVLGVLVLQISDTPHAADQ